MKRDKFFMLFLMAAILSACLFLSACAVAYSGSHAAPNINRNEVLHIKRNRLQFAKDMEINTRQIIEKCEISLGDESEETVVTEADLKSGIVQYEEFDVKTAGSNKRITLRYNGTENYIFYDVNEYKVNFYKDEEQTEIWKTVTPYAKHNDELGLAVWINIEENNYSTDETVRAQDADGAIRFDGWYDSSANSVTGLYGLSAPFGGNERVVNLHAHYITQEQLSVMQLEYDGSGNRVFSGYIGEPTESIAVPEGVTSIKFSDVFSAADFGFRKIRIPSTAKLDVPLMYGVNTAGLSEIAVDSGNLRYASYNGALYSKDYKTLYFMPSDCNRNELHAGLTELGSYSCAYWNAVTVSLPETVTALQHYCFAYSALKNVDGLKNVRTIMAGVFYKSQVSAYDDGIAQYVVLSDGSERNFSLSFIIDKTVTDYKVIAGTVGISGDAFRGCEALVSVDLGDDVESIGSSAFSGCSSLASVALPPSLRYMGKNVFYGCSSLTSVTGLSDIVFTGDATGYRAHMLPDYTFYNCNNLREITLPDGMTHIGQYAFYGCAALTEITFPNTVTVIDSYAFSGSGIENITLPASLTTLGNYAFSHSGVRRVDFSACARLKTLPTYCFAYSQLQEVDLPTSITSLPNYCFYNIEQLKRVSLGGVVSIGTYAFGRCASLTDIDLNKVKTIGTNAFRRCTALQEVALPDSVTSVGGYAFANCDALRKMTIGKGLKEFGNYTFLSDNVTFDGADLVLYLCGNLREIIVDEKNANFQSVDGVLYGNSAGGRNFGTSGVLYALPSAYAQENIVLPSTVRVTTPYSAHGLRNVKGVTLNEGLENIGKATFYNALSLTTLSIPSTVTTIGAGILLNCGAVSEVSLAPGNETYTFVDGQMCKGNVLVFVINNMVPEEFTIRSGITEIASGMFMNNTILKTITIPDSVTKIDTKAFNGCTNLMSINIGAGLGTLAPDAFSALPSLAQITVSANNPNFKAVNNALYSKDGKKLLLVAAQNGMTNLKGLESGVTEIGDWAFGYHATLAEVALPPTIKSIGDYSFYECRKLEIFYANEALERIGLRAFSFATSIDAKNSAETRFCDVLKEVLLYGNIKEIGENAFYGQYGIDNVYFHMSSPADITKITSGSKNITYLTKGCPKGTTGTTYNAVVCCLYSAVEPTIEIDGYSWFYINEHGEPEIWTNANAKI